MPSIAPDIAVTYPTAKQTTIHHKIEARQQVPQQFLPLELESRPTVSTDAAAHYLHLAPQTLLIYACRENGPLRPLRLPGSSRLHWRTDDLRRLLGVL